MEAAESAYNSLIKKIKEKKIPGDKNALEKAYKIACTSHCDQKRESGEPYIIHPLSVALILADMELDMVSIIAAVLHDVVEDTEFTLDGIKKDFGSEVSMLVDGVTKLDNLPYFSKEEQQNETFRKMLISMAKDLRVVLIKLADRLHNMRTLQYRSKENQYRVAKETIELYAPLANRLGIQKVKAELEDLSLIYMEPLLYEEIIKSLETHKYRFEMFMSEKEHIFKIRLKELKIENTIESRFKHIYSIYRKMRDGNKNFDDIFDIFATRIIVRSDKDCYAVLGVAHELFRPMPGRFKDYIAMPKPNGYKSLHTTLVGHDGMPFEIQIRTWAMHEIAESGVAAHWKYKEKNNKNPESGEQISWLRNMLDWEKEERDPDLFLENLKIELFSDEVFVFTPKGDVYSLPVNSTPIDFAYAIHSAIGNKMIGAKVNDHIVTIDYKLKNGDRVEILTSNSSTGPKRDWLKIVKSNQARNKIKQWFKKEKRDENILRGKEMIDRELKRQDIPYATLFKPEWTDIYLNKFNFANVDDLFAGIGYGAISANKLVTRLKEEYKKKMEAENPSAAVEREPQAKKFKKKRKNDIGIIVEGIDNCLIRLSKCCNPVPGDEIVGYITRGRGVSIHTADCSNVNSLDSEIGRIIKVRWQKTENASYLSDLLIYANDRRALLLEVTKEIAEEGLSIAHINADKKKNNLVEISVTLEISSIEQLYKIMRRLGKIDSVYDVKRRKNKVEKEDEEN